MTFMQQKTSNVFSKNLHTLIDALTTHKSFHKRYASIKNANLSHEDVFNYQHFCNQSYTRNLIYDSPQFSIILMCWQQNQESKIHDHNNSDCVMLCLSGALEERRYKPVAYSEHSTLTLECIGVNTLNPGNLAVINNKISLHKIKNVMTDNALTLHFYFPGIQECTVFNESGETQKISSEYTSKFGIREKHSLV